MCRFSKKILVSKVCEILMNTSALTYPVTIEAHHADGVLHIRARDFPELQSYGDDADDALLMAADALMTCIENRAARHESIPRPTKLRIGEYAVMPTWVFHKAQDDERRQIVTKLKTYSNI